MRVGATERPVGGELDSGRATVLDPARSVSELRIMASALRSRWNELDEATRLDALRRIERQAILLDRDNARDPSEVRSGVLKGLTRRELEVLQALADAGSSVRAAAKLHISVSTVRSHVKSVLTKLGVHSRTQAVALALRYELIPLLSPPAG